MKKANLSKVLALLLVCILSLGVLTACNKEEPTCEHAWVDATCTTPKTCSLCQATEGEALGHTAGAAATCTAPQTCTVCNAELAPAKGHTEETVKGQAATCTENGITDGKKCSVCDVITVAQEVITAKGHKDENNNYECDVCFADMCTNHVEEIIPGTAATCTQTGLTAGKKCSVCGDILVAQEITSIIDHTWVAGETVAPTFEDKGYTEYTCACGASKQDDFVDAKVAVATADGVKYETFAEAFAAGGEIVLLADVELNAPLVVEGTLVLDLNGKTLSYTSTVMGEAMITNKGNLTIKDSAETGVINYNYVGANDASYGKGNYTISNGGTLTVNGGKITIANLRQHAKYPIDNNNTTGDAILVINGGWLYNYNTSAIRMFCNSTTYKNSVTVNGGVIEGYCAIWIQNPGSKTVNGDLTITGGEIKTTAAAWVNGTSALKDVSSAVYCTIAADGGAWSEDSFITISGGTFNENVYLIEDAPAVTITAGTFNGYVEHNHVYAGLTCTTNGTCACGAVKEAVGFHTDANKDYKCDTCSTKVLPADGTALTIPEALAIGNLYTKDNYTTEKYYITGIVSEVQNTTYGNIVIKDADGNSILLYGLYTWGEGTTDGTRYDKMEYKPVVGDEITVYTKLGFYTAAQGKNAWLDEVVKHEHNWQDATCKAPVTCAICGTEKDDVLADHKYVNGECSVCGQKQGVTYTTESMNIFGNTGTLAANKLTITWVGENFTATGNKNTSSTDIRTSDSDHFRVYVGSSFTIACNNGAQISEIVITSVSGYIPTFNAQDGVTYEYNSNIITIKLTTPVDSITLSAGAQWRLSKIEVTTTPPCEHNYGEGVVTAPTCTAAGYTTHTCTICGSSYKDNNTDATGHNFVDGKCACGATQSTTSTVVLEITKDDFTTTSYADNNKTHTENGYSYKSNQVYQNGSMQWQKNTGYISITDNQFTKLEIKVTSGTFTVTVGGKTVNGTTANGVTTYDLSNLTGEVKIAAGGTTGKTDYIKFYK